MRDAHRRDALRPPPLAGELDVLELERRQLVAVDPARRARVDDAVEGADAVHVQAAAVAARRRRVLQVLEDEGALVLEHGPAALGDHDAAQQAVRARVAVVEAQRARQPVHRAGPEDGVVERLHERHLAVVPDGAAAGELGRVHRVQQRAHGERVQAALVAKMRVVPQERFVTLVDRPSVAAVVIVGFLLVAVIEVRALVLLIDESQDRIGKVVVATVAGVVVVVFG